jgi:hypothetical protein
LEDFQERVYAGQTKGPKCPTLAGDYVVVTSPIQLKLGMLFVHMISFKMIPTDLKSNEKCKDSGPSSVCKTRIFLCSLVNFESAL